MKTVNRDWLNANETRNYPIKEGLDRRSSSGFVVPHNFIVDMRLSGTKDRFEVSPTVFNNVDYFILEIERVASTDTILRIREIHRETYNPGDSSTFSEVGEFTIPYGFSENNTFYFQAGFGSEISGEMTVKKPLDFAINPGTQTFAPENTTLEARVLIPVPGQSRVTAILKDGDAFRAFNNVLIGEKPGMQVTPIESANGLRFDFVATKECSTLQGDECLDDSDVTCHQPAVMTINKTPSDRSFNFKVSGSNSINISTLPVLIPGGNPFNPNDFNVNSIVVTYHGPITTEFLGGDPLDFNNYIYGMDCKQTVVGKSMPALLVTAQSLLEELDSRRSILSLI